MIARFAYNLNIYPTRNLSSASKLLFLVDVGIETRLGRVKGEDMPKQGRRPEQRPAVGEKEVFQTAPSTWKSLVSNASAHKAIQLVFLCAVYSPISWLTLTPVYGGVPSALYHHQAKVAAILVGFLGRKLLRKLLPKNIARCLPGFAFSIPIIQLVLFRYSSFLGLPYGPLITQLLTYFPLVALSMYVAGECLEQVDLQGGSTTFLENGAVVFCYLVFTFFERFIRGFLIRRIGSNLIFSRVGLQMAVAMMYALVLPTAFWWPAPVSLAFTMTYNVHLPLQRTTDLLDSNLQPYNFSLIDRQESITGYLSVLENTEAHYRVLRCDHSLLGGEWTHFRQNVPGSRGRVQEPIYAIFTMLEAVRLVELPRGGSRRPDSESTALNIGLGTGTAASALIAHGVATTIVELDPTVHKFALKHFDFPTNHTPIIGDAVQFVKAAQRDGNKSKRYDYIIHDVFTGGAEPAELFTEEFLSGLRFLLKEDGVVAVVWLPNVSCAFFRQFFRLYSLFFPWRSPHR